MKLNENTSGSNEPQIYTYASLRYEEGSIIERMEK